jgi:hypothetical protein
MGPVNDLDQKMHAYEIPPHADRHAILPISELLPFGRL